MFCDVYVQGDSQSFTDTFKTHSTSESNEKSSYNIYIGRETSRLPSGRHFVFFKEKFVSKEEINIF